MTIAELETAIDNLDTKIQALRNAPTEVETQGADGARVRVRRDPAYIALLQKERALLIARLVGKRGDASVEPSRVGIDIDRNTDNGDW